MPDYPLPLPVPPELGGPFEVWKYRVRLHEHEFQRNVAHVWKFQAPASAKPLGVALQDGEIMLWYRVRGDGGLVATRQVLLIGCGHPWNGAGDYMGTVLMHDDRLVCHVFDLGED